MDVVVVVVVLLAGWFETDRVGLDGSFWDVAGGPWLVVNLVTASALLLRRTRPLVPFALALLSCLLVIADDRGPLTAPSVVVVYSLAVYRSTRTAAAAAVVLVVSVTVLASLGGLPGGTSPVPIVLVLIGLLVGVGVGDRRRYLVAVLGRAEQLARERDQRAQLAVAGERARIARELHDVVAHGLSVIVRLSDGADAVADADPVRSRQAIRQIGQVGRDSLGDMRRLLGVLSEGEDEPQLVPQPSLAQLDQLVATYRAAGLPVVVERSGHVRLDLAAQLVVFRAVQEGLTNALRYARLPSRVDVRLRFDETVEVEVVDDGAGDVLTPVAGSGRGLLGLRERASLYGGSVQAGSREDGRGWRLLVRMPVRGGGQSG